LRIEISFLRNYQSIEEQNFQPVVQSMLSQFELSASDTTR
jgi:hypothetical protein